MAGFTAINDLGILYNNKERFKTCSVTFNKKGYRPDWPQDKPFKLSQLINPKFTKCKNGIVCFSDGIIELVTEANLVITTQYESNEEDAVPIELCNEFDGLNICEVDEIKGDREFAYQKEKVRWVNTFSKNPRLVNAIRAGYECDDQYCLERLSVELPGFFLVNETTIYWKDAYPTENGLEIEKHCKLQINGSQSKYGTFTRLCIIEEHNHQPINAEGVVIVNYLNNFEVIALVDQLVQLKREYEQKLECQRTALLSNQHDASL